jgi:hypothetical protein
MRFRRTKLFLIGLCAVLAAPAIVRAQDAPRILLDQPARAVEYQLGRLTSEELILVERKDTDPKYRLVYLALLTRKGMPSQYRDEAIAALVKLDKSSRTRVLLEALAKVPADDNATGEKLLSLLLNQPAASLRADRDAILKTLETASEPFALRGGYGALMLADGSFKDAAQTAAKHDGHLAELIRATPQLPAAGDAAKLREQLSVLIADTLKASKDQATTVAALGALGFARPDAATFQTLERAIGTTTDVVALAAAVRSLQAIPEDAWPPANVATLARTIVAKVGELDAAKRTEPDALDVIQFGDRLAAKVPGDAGLALRRDLRAIGVRVVRIQTLPEKLSFDLRWFAVEAGTAVQIALVNVDAMPHNLVVGQPGSLEAIGTAGGAMPMPTDPAVKPFVPSSPQVLFATGLVKEGDTERLAFTAPKTPGEYIFVCTFPGHWVRMYGVMLVVDKLEAWEARPTVPTDPVTKQPFTSQRN